MKQRSITFSVAALVFLLVLGIPALAQVDTLTDLDSQEVREYRQMLSQGQPVTEVQLVFSLTPWNGVEYGGTFAPYQESTMYLMADEKNLINTLRTEVYFWPITGEFMADWFGMREEVPGRLQILQGNQVIQTLEKRAYVYSYPDGYAGPVSLVLDQEAENEFERYDTALNEYFQAANEYYELDAIYRREIQEVLRRVQETGVPAAEDEIPKAPEQPMPPQLYVTPVREAFVLELPAGRYTVQLVDESGNPVPNARKALEVFSHRREGIGYEVVPEHKWTRSFQTSDPAEMLYLEGRRVFFLNPQMAQEFNQLQYQKMETLHNPLHGEGAGSSWMWVHTGPVAEDAKLQILRDGVVVQEVTRKPYLVRQSSGYALGYTIVEWDPDDPFMQDRQPSFYAYRVELEAVAGGYTMQMVDASGVPLPQSAREIRAINNDPTDRKSVV